jgi:putative transposase
VDTSACRSRTAGSTERVRVLISVGCVGSQAALTTALGRRQPPRALVHHFDRGTQYASAAYQQHLRAHGHVGGMSRRANCWDNTVVESFFATLKTKLIHRRGWNTRSEARDAIAEYIEVFYNAHRLHSSVGYRMPNECEKEFIHTVAETA